MSLISRLLISEDDNYSPRKLKLSNVRKCSVNIRKYIYDIVVCVYIIYKLDGNLEIDTVRYEENATVI